MHKWLPNLVATFWLPNLVLYQTHYAIVYFSKIVAIGKLQHTWDGEMWTVLCEFKVWPIHFLLFLIFWCHKAMTTNKFGSYFRFRYQRQNWTEDRETGKHSKSYVIKLSTITAIMRAEPRVLYSKSAPYIMMTSSNGNIFRVPGHLCGEFTGPRWIPRTKASDAELWCFPWSAPE